MATTIRPSVNRGVLRCGTTVTGNTALGEHTVGEPSKEAHYSITVDSCGNPSDCSHAPRVCAVAALEFVFPFYSESRHCMYS